MYVPKHFEETNVDVLHELVRAHPLGALVTLTRGGLEANHIPFLVQPGPSRFGTLHGHIARANPLWKDFSREVEALVIFQGPETFISPSWYSTKKETGRVVPTWNYVVVHAHGPLRVMDDRGWLRAHLEQLTDRHEAANPAPWKITDAPGDYIEQMIGALVGLEIPVTRIEGKWKVSQNRSERDRVGVIEGLTSQGTDPALAMARLVKEKLSRDDG